MPTTRTIITKQPFVIEESCVIEFNSDYQVDYIEHYLNNAFVSSQEDQLSPQIGRNIDTSLTRINIAINPNLEVVYKEVSHSEREVESKLKRSIKRKCLNRRKRPPTDG